MEKTHIMVDIEALGNDYKTGPIIAIGAMVFEMNKEIVAPTEEEYKRARNERCFYYPIELLFQNKRYGFVVDDETLKWWLDGERSAQLCEMMFSDQREDLASVLGYFSLWVKEVCGKKDQRFLRLWSHGSTYDCVHLAEKWPIVFNASFNYVCPFRQMRDTRTLFDMYSEKFEGASPFPAWVPAKKHHPLNDTYMQVIATQTAWRGLVYGK